MQAFRQDAIALTAKQSNIYVWAWNDKARHRVAVCGRRFGKTYLAAREIKDAARRAAKKRIHPDNEIWYGAPTFKQAKRVFWTRLKRAIPKSWIDGKPNASDCSILLKSGHVIRLVGLDNYDDLRGSGLYFFVGDEWADCQPACWTEVIQPMLATCRGHSLKIGTPKGFNHFYEDFQKGQPGGEEDYRSWSYTTVQGGNVPQDEIDRARRELDPRTFQQEWEAAFVNYAGRVIYAFNRLSHVRPCPYLAGVPIHVGMDFNVNPMSATIWQEHDAGSDYVRALGLPFKFKAGEKVSVQIGEVVIPTSDTVEMSREICERYGKRDENGKPVHGMHTNGHITIYPDPAGAQARTSAQGKTDISILKDPQFGFRVQQMSSHPLVRDRNGVLNARFCNVDGTHRMFIDPSCKKSIEAYERHEYKEGTSEPDKGTGFDHIPDSAGYYTFVRFGGTVAKQVKIIGF